MKINSSNIVAQSGAPLNLYTEFHTFTPTIVGGSTPGTASYSEQVGTYTKIGNLVFITGELVWTGHTGTGDLLIANLPFNVRNTTDYDPEYAVRTASITWPGGCTMVFGEFLTGTSTGRITGIRSGDVDLNLQMSAAGTVHFTGFYLTSSVA